MRTGKRIFGGHLGKAVLFVAAALMLQTCGKKSDSDDDKEETEVPVVTAASLIADPQLLGSIVNATHGDSVSAAADQGASGAKLGLTLADGDTSSVTKTCAEVGNNAVVTVESNVNRTDTKTMGSGANQKSRTISRVGNGKSTRTWSLEGGTVLCNQAKTGAKINFETVPSVKLDVNFERSRIDTITFTGPRGSKSASKGFSSSGTRSITFTASTQDDTTDYTRRKSVVIKDVNQTVFMTNKDGVTVGSRLNINTAEGKPLVVDVLRDQSTSAVREKTFVSGEVVTKKDTDATMTTTYSNLTLNFDDGVCSVKAGSAQIVVTDGAGAVLKNMTLAYDAAALGGASLKDANGEDVEDFSLDPCDPEDVKL